MLRKSMPNKQRLFTLQFYHLKHKSKYKIHILIRLTVKLKKTTYIHELVLFVQVQFRSAYYLDCHKYMT